MSNITAYIATGKIDIEGQRVILTGSASNKYGPCMIGGDLAQTLCSEASKLIQSNPLTHSNAILHLGKYGKRNVFVQRAADQVRISVDSNHQNPHVKLIARRYDPGLGLLALAGGFIDQDEQPEDTAKREETEEADGPGGELLNKYFLQERVVQGDVRLWNGNQRDKVIENGDIIVLSTTAFIPVVKNAHIHRVLTGDDASKAGWIALSDLPSAQLFGIREHAKILSDGAKLAGLETSLSEEFQNSLLTRTTHINFATHNTQSQVLETLDNNLS